MEDVSVNSFKICLRELQNFAGVHDDISVVSVFTFRNIAFVEVLNVITVLNVIKS